MKWRFCPECGDVRRTDETRCEINGAGAEMVEIPAVVAHELMRSSHEAVKDDGTWLRVGKVAIGRDRDHQDRPRWFVTRWRGGMFYRTGYGKSPLKAARMAFPRNPSRI